MTSNLNDAFVCIIDRTGAELTPGTVDRLAQCLSPYGGVTSGVQKGAIGIAIRHADGCDRLIDSGSDALVAVAGEIHSAEVSPGSQGPQADPPQARELHWLAETYLQRGTDFLRQLTTPFVFIAADPARNSLTLARDHLGQFKVYYYVDQRWLIAASEPAAILAHSVVGDDVDEYSAARFLAFDFFSYCAQLLPGYQGTTAGTLFDGKPCRLRDATILAVSHRSPLS